MSVDELRRICAANGIAVSLAGTIRLRDAARLTGISLRTLERMCRDGELPGLRARRTWRISLAAVLPLVALVALVAVAADSTAPPPKRHARRVNRCSTRRRRSVA